MAATITMMTITANTIIATDTPMATPRLVPFGGAVDVTAVVLVVIGLGGGSVVRALHISGGLVISVKI